MKHPEHKEKNKADNYQAEIGKNEKTPFVYLYKFLMFLLKMRIWMKDAVSMSHILMEHLIFQNQTLPASFAYYLKKAIDSYVA